MIQRFLFVWLFLLAATCARAEEFPGLDRFMDEMVKEHQFARSELEQAFAQIKPRQSVIDAISRPATLKPWLEYRAAFVNKQRVTGGLAFWQTYADALQRAEKQYGVPQEIIVALIGIETRYGVNMGKYGTLEALSTLAFGYPRRADFFRSELGQYLLLAREQGFDLLGIQGSYAGALGIPQFMPGSYRKYAVDFNGDGKVDLLHEPVDAIGSVANFLKQHGWVEGAPVTMLVDAGGDWAPGVHDMAEWAASGVKASKEMAPGGKARMMDFTVTEGKEHWLAFANFDAITRYNNSDFYAMTVFQLAQALREAHN